MSFVQNSIGAGRIDTRIGVAPAHAGSFGGEQVQVKDLQSILSDAREELSAALSDKITAKDISEREISAGPHSLQLKIEQVEKINAYLEATRRYRDASELAAVIQQVRISTHPQLAAGRQGGRASHQYALIESALQEAIASGASADEIERLDNARADVMLGREDEIHADLNTAQAAADFAPTATGVEAFQRTYADIVLGKASLNDALQFVLRRLAGTTGEQLADALRAMLTALGQDLSSSRASTSSVRLQALIEDMYQLQVVVSVFEGCGQLARDIEARFQLTGVVPMELMQELVAMTNDRWLTPQRLRELAARFDVQLLLARIAFHTGTKNALRKLPVKVFPDSEVRRAMLDTAQQVLDEAVAEEEERQGS